MKGERRLVCSVYSNFLLIITHKAGEFVNDRSLRYFYSVKMSHVGYEMSHTPL